MSVFRTVGLFTSWRVSTQCLGQAYTELTSLHLTLFPLGKMLSHTDTMTSENVHIISVYSRVMKSVRICYADLLLDVLLFHTGPFLDTANKRQLHNSTCQINVTEQLLISVIVMTYHALYKVGL